MKGIIEKAEKTKGKTLLDEKTVSFVLNHLEEYRATSEKYQELLLSNLVMVGEIPAPTFNEADRIRFLHDRFTEIGLTNISTDEADNALGILNGTDGKRNILLVAHTDGVFAETVDHTVRVLPDVVSGPGLGDNALGVAVVATIPRLLEHIGIALKSNLILMGASRSLGRGNLEGLRFFVENKKMKIDAAVCVEGVEFGRLSHYSSGMLRGEIICRVPEEYDWNRYGIGGAVFAMNEVINAIAEISLPMRPRTTVNLGNIEGGTSYNKSAKRADLRFEIRSESAETVDQIDRQLSNIVTEIASRSGAGVEFNVVARSEPVNLPFSHPLPKIATRIMQSFGMQPRIQPSVAELAVLLKAQIPTLTIGITHAERLNDLDEAIMITPMFQGLAQLIGIIVAIDMGCCDEY